MDLFFNPKNEPLTNAYTQYNILKEDKNNPRCDFHTLQKKIDSWLQFLRGLVCFHPNKLTLIFSSNRRLFFFGTNLIHQWIPTKFKCFDMMIDLHPSPLVLDAPNLSQI